MKKWIVSLLTIVMMVSLLVACGTSNKEDTSGENGQDKKEKLIMGTSADYPPFEYIDSAKNEEIIGFDVDLAKAIGDKLGYEIEVKDMDFNGLVTALKNGQIQLVLSGMTPTPDRMKSVDFSDIYYTAHHMLVTTKDSDIKSVEDLKGKVVGAQMGSIQEEKANEIAETIKVTVENRNRIPELIQELLSGRMDAVIIEDIVAQGYLDKNDKLAATVIPDAQAEEAGSAIAFQKDSELKDKFNDELIKMKENGELDKLVIKWFGGEK